MTKMERLKRLNVIVRKGKLGLDTAHKLAYNLAIKKARKIGGKIYRGKDFGGGIVFQSYDIQTTINKAKGV